MTLLLALAAAAAAVTAWRCCIVLRVEPVLDELDQAVVDNAVLMLQKTALLGETGVAGQQVLRRVAP